VKLLTDVPFLLKLILLSLLIGFALGVYVSEKANADSSTYRAFTEASIKVGQASFATRNGSSRSTFPAG
jgi:hypothetical protein